MKLIFLFLLLPVLCFSQMLNPELQLRILKAKQGAVIELEHFLHAGYPVLPYQKLVMPGPQLLLSDNPEYIRDPEAVALREQVTPGTVRIYLYNVNGVQTPQKMVRKMGVVLKNTGTELMHLRWLKFSSQSPTTNYYLAGKNGLSDYFASVPAPGIIEVLPGASLSLDSGLEQKLIQYNELAHGIYEFVIDQPGEIAVVQTAPGKSTAGVNNTQMQVAASRHMNAGRGRYGTANYRIEISDTLQWKEGETRQLILADGKYDPWIRGIDASNGKISELAGNYGVMYQVKVPWRFRPGYGLALLTWNSRAADNQWCGGMAGAMEVSGGKFRSGIIQLPSDRLNIKKAPEAILIQLFTPAPGKEFGLIEFTYSPPGASCLPAPLVFVWVKL